MTKCWFPLRSSFGAALCAGMIALSAAPAGAEELTLIGPDFPPYYMEGEDGRMEGELVTLFDRILRNAGLRWRGVGVRPAKRTMHDLVAGKADASLLVDNPLLSKRAHIIRTRAPVGELVLNFYAPRPVPDRLAREALTGKHVVVLRGYGYGGFRDWLDAPSSDVTVKEFDDEGPALGFLAAGRADFAVLYDVNYENAVAALGARPDHVDAAMFRRVPLYIHLNTRTVPDAEAVRARLENSALALALITPSREPHLVRTH